MSTKFSRRPRVQPPPKICKAPPVPMPPGWMPPQEQLWAATAYKRTINGSPQVNLSGAATLLLEDDPYHWRGSYRVADYRVDTFCQLNFSPRSADVIVTVYLGPNIYLQHGWYNLDPGEPPGLNLSIRWQQIADHTDTLTVQVLT